MPDVVISFVDGEIIHAATPEITFDLPIIEAEILSVDANTEIALIPLQAIRQIIVGDVLAAPEAEEIAEWDLAVFRFLDGQVLRASIAPDAMLGRHGGVWRAVEPDSDEMRTLAIPYSALKGVFRVRQWDGRALSDRMRSGPGERLDQLARILAERESLEFDAEFPGPPPKPLIRRLSRSRRERAAGEQPSRRGRGSGS